MLTYTPFVDLLSSLVLVQGNNNNELIERIRRLEKGIDRLNETMGKSAATMALFNKYTGSWKMRMLQGMALGLGSVLGATVVVGIALWLMKPFESIEALNPLIERLTDELKAR